MATRKPTVTDDEVPEMMSARGTIIPPLNIRTMKCNVIGTAPLIVHAWSQKAKLQMLRKHTQEAEAAKPPKEPYLDFLQSLYELQDGGFGFPSVAFKDAAVTACTSVSRLTKVQARQAFHVFGENIQIIGAYTHNGQALSARYDMVRILSGLPEMREDMVRISLTSDIRYRAQFWPWAATLNIRYNQNVLSEAQIFNLINTAGFAVGVGEWRPEKNGTNGLFELVTGENIGMFRNLQKQTSKAFMSQLRGAA